jgi:hypothetical protein
MDVVRLKFNLRSRNKGSRWVAGNQRGWCADKYASRYLKEWLFCPAGCLLRPRAHTNRDHQQDASNLSVVNAGDVASLVSTGYLEPRLQGNFPGLALSLPHIHCQLHLHPSSPSSLREMASASDPGAFPPSPLVFDPSAIFSLSSPAFPLTKLYTPIHIRKHATYTPHPAGHITTIQASWGPMTMHGSYYLVEDSGTDTPGVYGSTVEAWRETNRLVEGDVEGRGVWVKMGVVRAVQVADEHNVNK